MLLLTNGKPQRAPIELSCTWQVAKHERSLRVSSFLSVKRTFQVHPQVHWCLPFSFNYLATSGGLPHIPKTQLSLQLSAANFMPEMLARSHIIEKTEKILQRDHSNERYQSAHIYGTVLC